jgi:hypothetical protein
MSDGWYWHIDKRGRASMYRLWTGTSGRQQVYSNGFTRLSPRARDALLADKYNFYACPHPEHATYVSKRW